MTRSAVLSISESSSKPQAMRSLRRRRMARLFYGILRPNGIFGCTAAEALGQSLDLIIPERYRERHWHGYREVMASGRTRYGTEILRVPALHKSGRPLSIAFTVALLKSSSGEVQGIAAIVRDETVRWQEERELRRRVVELEQKNKTSHNSS